MERGLRRAGQATYVMMGAELAPGHPESRFALNEDALVPAIALLAGVAADVLIQG